MATESIFRSIVLEDPKDIERFINALEKAEEAAMKHPLPPMENFRTLTREEVKEYFGDQFA